MQQYSYNDGYHTLKVTYYYHMAYAYEDDMYRVKVLCDIFIGFR